MTNCCGDYHYADCPIRTGDSGTDYYAEGSTYHYLDGPEYYGDDDYDDEPFVDDDGPLWNEDAGMEAGLWGSEA